MRSCYDVAGKGLCASALVGDCQAVGGLHTWEPSLARERATIGKSPARRLDAHDADCLRHETTVCVMFATVMAACVCVAQVPKLDSAAAPPARVPAALNASDC